MDASRAPPHRATRWLSAIVAVLMGLAAAAHAAALTRDQALKALDHPAADKRIEAIERLGAIGRMVDADALMPALDDDEDDVRAAATYAQGWIPGAVHFDLFGISLNDTSPRPLAAFMWMMQHLFEQRGVNLDKTVVFYEGISGMRAARGFWLLEYLGHTDAHVLDGGFQAWQAAGNELISK